MLCCALASERHYRGPVPRRFFDKLSEGSYAAD